MNFLGGTLESIASEKAGIIKKNSNAVLYFNDIEVYNTVERIAAEQNAGLVYCGGYDFSIKRRAIDETVFDVSSNFFEYNDVRLRMIGDYQVYNACNLMYAIRELNTLGVVINREHVYAGLSKARWPGRMELIGSSPSVLLDGAHNADGAREFTKNIENYFPGRKIILVTGMLRDKEYEKILSIVTERADRVILTKPEIKRALDPDELYKVFKRISVYTEIIPDYREAVEHALASANEGESDVVCVTGSLYLVADVRKFLIDKGMVKL